ncbi:nuclear transport factor 2 family protein [Microbacterium sp.]|uniref:nuclear transport factor 2 family protein n=1 Tax=Microbacterium sp. TaxID=51671 RepID=UPI002E320438|nr:nuclear transport factor 2 family protein [Microbacterium sp.]HEX5730840.1 nuclear transport factor 2 family protein [Microbacterium sp.]
MTSTRPKNSTPMTISPSLRAEPPVQARLLDEIRSGALRYQVFEAVSEVSVRAHEDVGVLRYQALIEIDFPDGHDDGLFWHTDIYEHRRGRWQVVWSQATRVPAGS